MCNEEGCASGWARGCQERIDVQVELRWPASGDLARRRLGRRGLTVSGGYVLREGVGVERGSSVVR
jgi:hypothetical protein